MTKNKMLVILKKPLQAGSERIPYEEQSSSFNKLNCGMKKHPIPSQFAHAFFP
jgi:hypothetical protein